jgi:hypothetical protein
MSTTSARGDFAVVGKGSLWEGIAYQYFGATVVILMLVSILPPNRPDNWLRL